ncbi:MAG: hypothetical protein QW238_01300 [Candidatus Bathyarchaeia archaeon]
MNRVAAPIVAAVLGLTVILAPRMLLPSLTGGLGPSAPTAEEMAATPTLTPVPTPEPEPGPPSRLKAVGGESVRAASPPFMVELDPESSRGFDEAGLAHGTYGVALFALRRGGSAVAQVLVSSLSDDALQLSLEGVEGVPEGVEVELNPESFTLQPHEQRRLELRLSVSPEAPPTDPQGFPPGAFVQLVLRGDGYILGAGFILKIV